MFSKSTIDYQKIKRYISLTHIIDENSIGIVENSKNLLQYIALREFTACQASYCRCSTEEI